MSDLIKISSTLFGTDSVKTVNARELHEFLRVATRFNDWIVDRIATFDFVAGTDYTTFTGIPVKGRPPLEYALSIDMAKELAMVERSIRGRQARQYFIQCERQLLSIGAALVPKTFSEALRLAADLQDKVEHLEVRVAQAQPAIEFHDAVTNMQGACKLEYLAKTLGHGRNKFFNRLRDDQVLMLNNMPYQRHLNSGYFLVIENKPYTNSAGEQVPTFTTVVTGKGQVWLSRKYPVGSV